MIYFFIVYIVICLYGISFKHIKKQNKESLSPSSTTMINGIFVIMIVFSHFNQYVTYTTGSDILYASLLKKVGQLMVTTFFFYSGYGIYESIKKKGDNYIKGFMKNRFLKVFLSFVLAVCCFLIMNLCLGRVYAVKEYLLSFIGLSSVGNSNWFMFATFILYIITYLSFRFFRKDYISNVLLVIIGTFIYIIVMKKIGYRSSLWYNTVLCYSAGMIFSYFKDVIWKFLENNCHYILVLVLNIILFYFAYVNSHSLFSYMIFAILFCTLIFLITYKVHIGNKILLFFGKNTFGIYILQRIPMIIFQDLISNIYLYFIVSFVSAVVLAYFFNKVVDLILKKFRIA